MLVHLLFQPAFCHAACKFELAQHHQEQSTLPHICYVIRGVCQHHEGATARQPAQMHSVPAVSVSEACCEALVVVLVVLSSCHTCALTLSDCAVTTLHVY